jgi:hypothetical protein
MYVRTYVEETFTLASNSINTTTITTTITAAKRFVEINVKR